VRHNAQLWAHNPRGGSMPEDGDQEPGAILNIEFARQARRRAKLYGIPVAVIENIVLNAGLTNGTHELVTDAEGFRYPLKVVAAFHGDAATVITSYPLPGGGSRTGQPMGMGSPVRSHFYREVPE